MKGRLRRYSKWSGNIIPGRYLPKMSKKTGKVIDRTRRLPSGYSVKQTYYGLEKAWLGYVISLNKNEDENRRFYASIIQRLQQELVNAGVVSAVNAADFPDLGLYAYNEENQFRKQLEEDFIHYVPLDQIEWVNAFRAES